MLYHSTHSAYYNILSHAFCSAYVSGSPRLRDVSAPKRSLSESRGLPHEYCTKTSTGGRAPRGHRVGRTKRPRHAIACSAQRSADCHCPVALPPAPKLPGGRWTFRVGTEVTFGRGDLSICPLRGFMGGPGMCCFELEGVFPQWSPQGTSP